MKSPVLLTAIATAALGFSSMAFAQHDEGRHARHAQRDAAHERREARQDLREAQRDMREARRDLRDAREQRAAPRYQQAPVYVRPVPIVVQPAPVRVQAPRYAQPGHVPHYGADGRHGNGYGAREGRLYRGAVVPVEYRTQRHVVRDWHGHQQLYAPPQGHQWLQVNGEFALVAIATGVIASLLLN